jgi:hypothetical protein
MVDKVSCSINLFGFQLQLYMNSKDVGGRGGGVVLFKDTVKGLRSYSGVDRVVKYEYGALVE